MRRYEWLWISLGLLFIFTGLSKTLAQRHATGDMIDQFHWSQLAQLRITDGQSTTLAGYMLPVSDSPLGKRQKMVTKFILVPYLPSCTQRPPPLSNQTVLVETKPIPFSTDPVIVRGEISALKSAESGAGFKMHALGLRPWSHGQFAQTDED